MRLGLMALGLVALLASGTWLASSGHLGVLADPERLRLWIEGLGPYAWMVLLLLLALNVVVSPIPSAPFLIATGAVYGPWLGSLIGLIGIQAGALVAFLIARHLGADAVRKLAGEKALQRLEGSQMTLAMIVLMSRVVPLVSFDVVSWVAGLTPLRTWLFTLANLLGITPMTVLMVLVGTGAVASDRDGALIAGSVIVVLLAIAAIFGRRYLITHQTQG